MSKKIAYSGILLAINIILLMFVNIIPMNTLILMALASLPISIIIMEFGVKYGVSFYIASSLLSIFVISDKIQCFIYIITFGIYGMFKYIIEKNNLNIVIEYMLKLVFANIFIIVIYQILRGIIYIPVNWITIILFQGVFLVYDYVYSLFIDYYDDKLKKILKIH